MHCFLFIYLFFVHVLCIVKILLWEKYFLLFKVVDNS